MATDLMPRPTARRPHHQPVGDFFRRWRVWAHAHPVTRWVYKVVIGLIGLVVVVVGLILVPLPGPGWLVVFIGIAVLGSEFPAAHRLNVFIKRQRHRFWLRWRAPSSRDRCSATARANRRS
jgi:uncharacterized protein (TIGR02611 family)